MDIVFAYYTTHLVPVLVHSVSCLFQTVNGLLPSSRNYPFLLGRNYKCILLRDTNCNLLDGCLNWNRTNDLTLIMGALWPSEL